MIRRTRAIVFGAMMPALAVFFTRSLAAQKIEVQGDQTITGKLGVGTTSPEQQIHSVKSGGLNLLTVDSYNAGGSNRSIFNPRTARGTFLSPSNVAPGDTIGEVIGSGYAGGAFRSAAAVNFYVGSGTISATSLPSHITFETTPDESVSRVERMRITSAGNVGIGTTSFGVYASRVLGFGSSGVTGPGSAVAGTAQLYAATSIWSPYTTELWVMDDAGNQTLLSSHSRALLLPDDPNDVYPWSFYSKNPYIGIEQNVDMVGAIRAIEQLTGKPFIFWKPLPAGEVRDWYADQQAQKEKIEAERREKAVAEAPEIEVALADAWELVEKVEEVRTVVDRVTYELDLEKLAILPVTVSVEVVETKGTGHMVRQLKPGVRFDADTGKLYRKPLLAEVTIEPIAILDPPTWIAARLAR